MPNDNVEDRQMSNDWDSKYSGQNWYDNYTRPFVHGVYHLSRSAGIVKDGDGNRTPNLPDFYRGCGQLSKIGKGDPNYID